ncbi:MAG TPA: peptidyl-prolyl cis-trans isomerase [Candidatus Margulisiibacteriota bacterium]|nr:peptidyl-prolyl cis-trans isomerase [Candidatus Margulisiibacteriota bacterium]
MRRVCAPLILALLFLAAGCDSLKFLNPKKTAQKRSSASSVVKGTPIAKVNNLTLTLEDLNQEIDAYNSMVQADKPELKITTKEQKVNYLKNEMIRRALFYQYALDKGVDKNEDIVKALEKNKMDLVVMGLLKQETGNIDVSSKEIEDAYNQYKEQFKEPEERQIREIVVSTEQEAKDILIQLLQGGDFATLAQTRSKADSAKNGGDLGFIQPGKKFAQFDNVAFADSLEAGKVSNIFNGPDGYYILKMEAKRGGKQKTLSEMWDDIKNILLFSKQKDKIDKLTGNLSREAKIEVYEGEIK